MVIWILMTLHHMVREQSVDWLLLLTKTRCRAVNTEIRLIWQNSSPDTPSPCPPYRQRKVEAVSGAAAVSLNHAIFSLRHISDSCIPALPGGEKCRSLCFVIDLSLSLWAIDGRSNMASGVAHQSRTNMARWRSLHYIDNHLVGLFSRLFH